MDDAALVREVERARDLARDASRPRVAAGRRPSGRRRAAVSRSASVSPSTSSRIEEADLVGFFESVDRADVRMIQRRERPRFALESRQPRRVAGERLRQHLDRDLAAELAVARAVDLAHAADADQRLQVDSRRACGRSCARGSDASRSRDRRDRSREETFV